MKIGNDKMKMGKNVSHRFILKIVFHFGKKRGIAGRSSKMDNQYKIRYRSGFYRDMLFCLQNRHIL